MSDPPRDAAASSPWRERLAVAAIGAAGLALAFYPMLLSGFARMQTDVGDTRHLNFVLEHVHGWLVRAPGHAPLFSPPIFYPEPNTGAYTELLLAVVPFYSAWRALGLAPDSAFQAWMVTVAALNYACAYLLLRAGLRSSRLASAAGAFLFSFGSSRLCQLNHQHLLPHFYTAIALLALIRFFEADGEAASKGQSAKHWFPAVYGWLGLFAACAAAQVYAGYYYAWFLAFALFIAALWALALPSTRGPFASLLARRWPAILLAVALVAAAVSPMALAYLDAARAVGFRSYSESAGMIPRFQSWLNLGGNSWLYGWQARLATFARLPMEPEHRLGLGLITTALAATALYRERRRPLVRLMALTAIAVVLAATLYRGRVTPWAAVFAWVPGANAIRAVSRIGILLLVPASVGLALHLDRPRAGRGRWIAFALAALALAEQGQRLEAYDKAAKRADVAALAARVPRTCGAFFYAPAPGKPEYETQLDAMWAALELGIPTVNGYSSNFPRGWELRDHAVRAEPDRDRLRAALSAWERSRGVAADRVCFVEAPAPPPPG